MTHITQACLSVVLLISGMAGLYFKVEYSGWVLFGALYLAATLPDRIEREKER